MVLKLKISETRFISNTASKRF